MALPRFGSVHIFGPGLMGASLALAIHNKKLARKIWMHDRSDRRRPRAARRSLPVSWIDGISPQSLASADLVLLCLPVEAIVPFWRRLCPHLKPGVLVMDVGSTKSEICHQIRQSLPDGVDFVGAHPMAGSEKKGLAGARPDFFDSAWCFLDRTAPDSSRRRAERFWRDLGSRVAWISPEKHDRAVARISHLPHVLANALLDSMFAKPGNPSALRYAGGGLAGMLRIAGTNPIMWRDIFVQNRQAVLDEISLFEKSLRQMRRQIASAPPRQLLRSLLRLERLKDRYEQIRATR